MKIKRKKLNHKNSGMLFILPALLVVASVMLFPLVYNIVLSFFEKTIYSPEWKFVGLEQYQHLLMSDSFLNALKNTIVWTFFSVLFQFAIGFACALVLSQDRVKFRGVWRCLIMLPWVLPAVIGSMVWKWMYHSDFGILNQILITAGFIDKALPWTGSKSLALISAIIVNTWKMFPLVILYIEASLQSVPKSLEDAAVVDGANSWNCFKVVTWPHIAGTCKTVVLLLTIWTLNAFTFIFVLTGGGPGTSSQVLSMFIYKEAFQNFNFGNAATASSILFIIVAIFSTIYIKSSIGGDES
ncbi:MAG: sugar ABC transporter permease [Hespellia sp.]|nr:sugar ABC transporter permease [Hespellia sp.]